jgi:hypothetical protein
MSVSRRALIRWAGCASGLALLAPDRANAALYGVGQDALQLRENLMPSADEVWDWQVWMAKLGPKYTGNAAHRTFVEFLATKLQAAGLDVARDAFTLPLWEARAWGLKATPAGGTSIDIPVTGYYPYSGQTLQEGVTGPLLYAGTVTRPERGTKWEVSGDVNGKIVLADVTLAPTPYEEWWKPWGFHTPDTRYPSDSMNGTWAIRVPAVGDLKAAGARGVIFVHTAISDEHAALLYAPFGRALQDMPALWVGSKAGAQLRQLAQSGAAVTLKLEADVVPDTPTETLIATLPGTSADEVIIVNTHTDGNNATEENGGLGAVALAQYFARLPKNSRKRTLVFVLATGHFAGAYVPAIRGVVERHPDLIKKAVGALTVEHLGCREWLDNGSMQYEATGKNEFTIAITEFESTARIMLESLRGTGDNRAGVVIPTPSGGFNGEGGALSRAGVPTIGYIPIPSYLLAGPDDGCIEKLSKPFLHEQLRVLAKVLHRMDAMSATELKGRGRLTSEDMNSL